MITVVENYYYYCGWFYSLFLPHLGYMNPVGIFANYASSNHLVVTQMQFLLLKVKSSSWHSDLTFYPWGEEDHLIPMVTIYSLISSGCVVRHHKCGYVPLLQIKTASLSWEIVFFFFFTYMWLNFLLISTKCSHCFDLYFGLHQRTANDISFFLFFLPLLAKKFWVTEFGSPKKARQTSSRALFLTMFVTLLPFYLYASSRVSVLVS